MNDILSELKKDRDFTKSKEIAGDLKEKYDVDLVKLFEMVSERDILIPVSIFLPDLSALETVSRYLHENLGLSFKKIGSFMNRSEKTIWQAYNYSIKKYQKKIRVSETRYLIPISAFSDRKYSNLESIVVFLKEKYGLKYSEIAILVHRDQRTVWTVYNRAMKKRAA